MIFGFNFAMNAFLFAFSFLFGFHLADECHFFSLLPSVSAFILLMNATFFASPFHFGFHLGNERHFFRFSRECKLFCVNDLITIYG
jgi:hypothetical protein